jgi:hypothetical protein
LRRDVVATARPTKLIDDNDEINTKSLPQVKNAEPGQFHRQVPAPDLAWYTLRLE